AGVLLVVVADAAVGRAAVDDLGGEAQGLGAGAGEGVGTRVVVCVLGDELLRGAAAGAGLLEVDLAAADDDLGLDQGEAVGARGGGALEEVVAGVALGDVGAGDEGAHVGVGVVRHLMLGLAAARAVLEHDHGAVAQHDAALDVGAAGAAGAPVVQEEGVGL